MVHRSDSSDAGRALVDWKLNGDAGLGGEVVIGSDRGATEKGRDAVA